MFYQCELSRYFDFDDDVHYDEKHRLKNEQSTERDCRFIIVHSQRVSGALKRYSLCS